MALDSDVVIVVDDNDNVIENIKAADFSINKRRRDTSIMLLNSKNELLIAQRHKSKKILPNCWGPTASGTVERHETYEKNAYKELYEELGISGINLEFHGNFSVDYGEHKRVTGIFTGVFDGNISNLKLEENEVEAARWVSQDDLINELLDDESKFVPGFEYVLAAANLLAHKKIEFTAIVDKNDNIICYKDRYKITYEDIPRIVVVWLEDSEGNALVHKRSMSKKAGPGRWENAAGGGVAHNQTYEQAAYAELEEEIGVTGINLEFVEKNIVVTPHGKRMCCWYKGVIDWPIEKFKLEKGQVDEIKYINKQELFNLRDKDPDLYMPSSIYWRELFDN
jgi:isopentenyl-diphosphate delta-isomerase